MRDNGVEHFADPTFGADGSVAIGGPDGGDEPAFFDDPDFEDATTACEDLLAGAGFAPAEGEQAELQDQLVAFTECLREQGLDVDDPQLGTGGAPAEIGEGGPFGDQIDPDDPDQAAALELCQDEVGLQPPGGGGELMALPVRTDETTVSTNEARPARARARRWYRRPTTWVLLLLALAAAAAAAVALLGADDGDDTTAESAVTLATATVEQRDVVQTEELDGTLRVGDTVAVTAGRAGTLTAVADPGDTVARGEELLRVDDVAVVLLYGGATPYRTLQGAPPATTSPSWRPTWTGSASTPTTP